MGLTLPGLILVKHSLPEMIPNLPAREWHLSDEGRRRCGDLAGMLGRYQPQRIVSSLEPKAAETGQLLAGALQIPCSSAPHLHEHERQNTPFLSPEMFEASVRAFFEQPARRVLGEETADQAHARFAGAVWGVVNAHPTENLVVVAHGTVISLFVGRLVRMDPFLLWKRLGLPAFIVLALPENQFITLENLPHDTLR